MEDNEYLRINLKALAAVGLWPIKTKSVILLKIHAIYCAFVMCYFGIFVTSEYIEIGLRLSENFFDIVNNLSVSLLYTVTVVKMKITKGAESQKFVNQIYKIEDLIMKGDDFHLKDIFKRHIKWNHNLSKLFISLTTFTIIPFFINPIITELNNPVGNFTELIGDVVVYKERALPFSSWFPFDKYKYYYLTFSFQIVAGCFGAALTCCTDIFFWGFMIYGLSQIKMLQHKLRNLRGYGEKFALENSMEVNQGIASVLGQCVILHQDLIQYIFELNQSLNFLMFMDFGICSMQIGVIGFQVVVSGFGWSQVFAMEYLLAMLAQMFLFYWHANEILLESLNISKSIWESDFYEYPIKIQKSLAFMMMRSQRALILKVGPFYAMSTTTALSIVRAAYSYVALMRQVYS